MIIPEINPEHAQVIEAQRKRLGTKRGFIAVKSNCSLQSYVPAIHPLMDLGVTNALACTYQAISGAGKTFKTFPEILDNVIPYIGGEEEKSENEPLKIWGHVENGVIVNAETPNITSQCLRVPVSDGHTAAVFVSFEKKVEMEEIIQRWESFKGAPQELNLPSAPKQFLHYFREDDRPSPVLTVIWKMVWRFLLAVFARISSILLNLSVFLTTHCGGRQVEPCLWRSFSAQRDILTEIDLL